MGKEGKKLFPAYLNVGSRGPAVAVLQLFLRGGAFNQNREVTVGEYDEETAEGVRNLQKYLVNIGHSVGDDGPDGNFGPKTREAVSKAFGIDFNALPWEVFQGETQAVGP